MPGESQTEIDDCFRSIDRLRRERSILRAQMVNAREAEVAQVEFAGYNGTLASIAQKYNDDEQKYGWGTGLLVPKIDEQFPLTADELRRWLALLRDNAIHENEEDAAQRLVDLQNIPDPSKLSDLIDGEAHSSSVAAQFQSLKSHPSFKDVATLPATDRSDLREQMRELARTAREAGATPRRMDCGGIKGHSQRSWADVDDAGGQDSQHDRCSATSG